MNFVFYISIRCHLCQTLAQRKEETVRLEARNSILKLNGSAGTQIRLDKQKKLQSVLREAESENETAARLRTQRGLRSSYGAGETPEQHITRLQQRVQLYTKSVNS